MKFLERFAEATGLRNFDLMGTSIGASLGVRYSLRHPEQVRSLILSSPYLLHGQAGRVSRLARRRALMRAASHLVMRHLIQRQLEEAVYRTEVVTSALVDAYWRPFVAPEGSRVVAEVLSNVVVGGPAEELLPEVAVPTLVVVGSEDPLAAAGTLERLRRLIHACRVVVILDSGHLLMVEAPEALSRTILSFVRQGR